MEENEIVKALAAELRNNGMECYTPRSNGYYERIKRLSNAETRDLRENLESMNMRLLYSNDNDCFITVS